MFLTDLYDEGIGAGVMGCDWLRTVAGRFLSQGERRALRDGWETGRRWAAEDEQGRRQRDAMPAPAVTDEIPW